ncbi:hypothetical protein PsalN5692_01806 [Piscirickettsia salmonis]|uniref:hypothetical protein n=1 Tax=Piscirickettsia salmonis TaxID=1238 RepID=UPI0012B9A882|nr:hypothetical protein [Piscirickettsia salmonis]QGP50342.1 hypothetical protein PsalN5692_01806 [Piscirickettsia salmonis]
MSHTVELEEVYQGKRFESERKRYQECFNAADALTDSVYLSESMLGYFEDVSGDELDFNNAATYYSSLSLFVLLGIFGLFKARGHFDKNENIDKHYKKLRTTLSGLKNGRHAVVNISGLVSIFSHHAVASSVVSPAGALGFAIGILLAANNLYKLKLEEKRNSNLKAIEQYVFNFDRPEFDQDFKKITPPNVKNNRKLIYTNIIDGFTDGLYLVGNAFMLLGLCGATSTVPPVAIGLCVAYGIYTLGSIINKYFKEKEEQLKEEFIYLKFLENLENQGKLVEYHDQFKSDPNYKKYIGDLSESDGAEEIRNKLGVTLKIKEKELNAKKETLQSNAFYKVYKMISKSFSTVRSYVNTIKNSLATVTGIDILASQHPLAQAAVSLGCIITGCAVAVPFLVYKTYCSFRPTYQLRCRQGLDYPDLLYFFNEYAKSGFLKKHNHKGLIDKLTDDYQDYRENYLHIFCTVNEYIADHYRNMNQKGELFLRYQAAKNYILCKHKYFSSMIKQLYKEYHYYSSLNINSDSDDIFIKNIRCLLKLYPATTKKEVVESLAIFSWDRQIAIIAALPEFIDDHQVIMDLKGFLSAIKKPLREKNNFWLDKAHKKAQQDFFNAMLQNYLDNGMVNRSECAALVMNINKLLNSELLYPMPVKTINFYLHKAAVNYLAASASKILKNENLSIQQKLALYQSQHDELLRLLPNMMKSYAQRDSHDSLKVDESQFEEFLARAKNHRSNSNSCFTNMMFYHSQVDTMEPASSHRLVLGV